MRSTTLEKQGMGSVAEEPARRERILAAAWQVLAQVGFEKITTRRIAEAAGINIATLHYHFGSKEAVLTETLRYAQKWADAQMRESLVGATSATEALDRAFAQTLKLMLERPGVLRFDLVVRGFRDPDSKSEAVSVYRTYQLFVCELIEWHTRTGGTLAPGLSANELVEYIVAVVDGVQLHHTLFGDDRAAERSLNRVQAHVWQLLELPPLERAETDRLHENTNTN